MGRLNWDIPFYIGVSLLYSPRSLSPLRLKMANTWEKFVILRAGKLRGVKGAGLFLIIPVIDHVVAVSMSASRRPRSAPNRR